MRKGIRKSKLNTEVWDYRGEFTSDGLSEETKTTTDRVTWCINHCSSLYFYLLLYWKNLVKER